MPTPHSPKFFITHSSKDATFAQRLADDLHSYSLDGFIDLYSIMPGDNFVKGIDSGLKKCDVFIPVMSLEALKSPWCVTEITAAIALSNQPRRKGRPRIIPILIEDCKKALPTLLQVLHWIDFAGRYDEGLRELLEKGFGRSVFQPTQKPVVEAPRGTQSVQINVITVVINQSAPVSEQVIPIGPTRLEISIDHLNLGNIKITDVIGSGGAATVYRGVALIDQSPVAVKVLHSTDPLIRKRFKEEGRIAFVLQHPHIARVYSYGEEGEICYIVMEYLDGGSLRQRLTHGMSLPLDFIRQVIGQTCEALSYAHSRGVIHRDVKPENILFSSRDGVKVADFGLAKLVGAASKASDGILIGTPYYMSYEQAAGLPVIPASDVYSLGVVLYEMLTGAWPFAGKQTLDVIHKRLTEKPTPPRAINVTIPPDVEAVVMRALDKNSRGRFQDAMEMAHALGYQSDVRMLVSPLERVATLPSASQVASAKLLIVTRDAAAKELKLEQNRIVSFGRADFDSSDNAISRQHFRVIGQADQFWLEDAGSSNGTFVNGERVVGRRILRIGDTIRAGQTTLIFSQ